MKEKLFIILLLLPFLGINAQCFTIETVLADACGDPEGENEMVTLRVNNEMDIANLVFDWPNNQFLDWCPNPTTTNLLNQTIISSCGFLLEPPNGVVPAGEKLIVVTSTNMLINANSFEGLSDTIYIIYQCAGNTSGHFSNMSSSPRSLRVTYDGICYSQQTVSYTGADLIGGDGGAAFYNEQGQRTYFNTGCNAPVPSQNPFWNISSRICEDYGLIDLNDLLSNNATIGGTWSGDVENNNFFNTIGKVGNYSITYTIDDATGCLGAVDSTLNFTIEFANIGRDTIERCDEIFQFGFFIKSDTIIDIPLPNSNPFRCDSTLKRFYKINQADFDISPEQITINSGESFNFNISGANNNFTYQYWNENGDSCLNNCTSTSLTPSENGPYTFEITDTESSCSKILDIDVDLIYFSHLNVPNTFTPNNDGQNDVFRAYGKDLLRFNIEIYSQWGERVYHSEDINGFWDGRFNNKALSSGIFLMQIDASGLDGQKFQLVEKIKLIR